VLASLPVLLSLAAVPGSILIARFGALRARGGIYSRLGSRCAARRRCRMLFAATFVMGIGIAIMQPSLPPSCASGCRARSRSDPSIRTGS